VDAEPRSEVSFLPIEIGRTTTRKNKDRTVNVMFLFDQESGKGGRDPKNLSLENISTLCCF
jgi:hypothetical protein